MKVCYITIITYNCAQVSARVHHESWTYPALDCSNQVG